MGKGKDAKKSEKKKPLKTAKEKKLAIAFVIPSFIPETYGGAEQQTLRLAISLKRHKK